MKEYNLAEWLFIIASGICGSSMKLLRGQNKLSPRYIAAELLTGLAFAFFIIPAIAEYYTWTHRLTCGATFTASLLSHVIITALESRLKKITKNIIEP